MIIRTPTVVSVLYACVLYFCICSCSAQLSMFHMERRSKNTLIVIIIIIWIPFELSNIRDKQSRIFCRPIISHQFIAHGSNCTARHHEK